MLRTLTSLSRSRSSSEVDYRPGCENRNDAVVFAIFLTNNHAFITSVYDAPPTYGPNKKPCRIVDAEMYKKSPQEYEAACVELLHSGKFQRVHIYVDTLRSKYQTQLLSRLLQVCEQLNIHADMTNTPRLENKNSPRTRALRPYVDAFKLHIERLDVNGVRRSRQLLVDSVDRVAEKMKAILTGKLLNTRDLPDDADAMFAFHDCWKELYDIVKEESQLSPRPDEHSRPLTPEEIQTERLYCLDVTRFYSVIELQ